MMHIDYILQQQYSSPERTIKNNKELKLMIKLLRGTNCDILFPCTDQHIQSHRMCKGLRHFSLDIDNICSSGFSKHQRTSQESKFMQYEQ